ncbi:hypothetical protein D3C76_1394150 [compost metagenome]
MVMPGMFCDVMVTRNSGRAMPSRAPEENSGQVQTGLESCQLTALSCSSPLRVQSNIPALSTSTMV